MSEICRTCKEPYPAAGDGYSGECPSCADKTFIKERVHDREARTERALRGYLEYGGERETALIDILSDLRHHAAEHGLNFDDAARISENHFDAEKVIVTGRVDLKKWSGACKKWSGA